MGRLGGSHSALFTLTPKRSTGSNFVKTVTVRRIQPCVTNDDDARIVTVSAFTPWISFIGSRPQLTYVEMHLFRR